MTEAESTGEAWQLPALVRAVSLLAATASEQEAHLQKLGSWPSLDELGLEFDDIYLLVGQLVSGGAVSADAGYLLEQINGLLAQSGLGTPRFWHADSLGGADWQRVRVLASAALERLPQPKV